jgi:hypothetical protein
MASSYTPPLHREQWIKRLFRKISRVAKSGMEVEFTLDRFSRRLMEGLPPQPK